MFLFDVVLGLALALKSISRTFVAVSSDKTAASLKNTPSDCEDSVEMSVCGVEEMNNNNSIEEMASIINCGLQFYDGVVER